MKRREFITLLGGAVAWPIGARAQQPPRMRRIGVLMNLTAEDPESPARLAAFAQGLADLGWSIGRNLRIDYRWAGADPEHIRKDAEELVALTPDLILSSGTPTVAVLQKAIAACQSYSRRLSIQLAAGSLKPWRDWVVISPAFPSLSTASAGNGWNC